MNVHDLQFVLRQIKISEAHAAGTPLTDMIDDPLLPHGVRTVDGSYNNLEPGREYWGAADQPFPHMLDPQYINENDGDTFDPDGPFGPANVNNTDYAQPGDVADANPRIISNLIVDQTINNPAAVVTALRGVEASDTDIAATMELQNALTQARMAAAAASEEEQQAADAAVEAASTALLAKLAEVGVEVDSQNTLVIENVAPDDGISAPFSSIMTLFGQFFDHGLDLVAKGQNGTVYIPLQPDDPLYVEGGHTNFMVLTRTTASPGADGVFGTADDVRPLNLTTPFVDQNQTYTSHASHQVFLREYVAGPDGKPIATGNLLNGEAGGLPTWADIKAQALNLLGIKLVDADVTAIPLLATDQYGNFIPGPNGYAQIVFPGDPPVLVEGTAEGVLAAGSVRTGHAFLDDIAHNAVPHGVYDHDGNPATPMIAIGADADSVADNTIAMDSRGNRVAYDNELLDAHFITGDGRGNENIGLTTIHHIFHSEHNRQIAEIKETILSSGDAAFINEWYKKVSVNGTEQILEDANGNPVWDGERLFQAARFATEMQYQHLVFEEFGRKIQPDIDLFVFNSMADIDPSIFSEFADVVYRFGHSMLRDTVNTVHTTETADGLQHTTTETDLIDAFLNPTLFASLGNAEEAAGSLIRGMTRQVGNEIDEFVTDTLRNNLLGLPLDLATINITRARENGVPTLNQAREKFFETTGDTQLKPYENWTDFAYNLKNPASIINFIAAYGTHDSITGVDTVLEKRAAATALVMGGSGAPADRLDFLNSTGAWANAATGLDSVDLWIGGLAEKKMSFGGMLGSTFAYVFETTMENLQNGDRFYYLTRTQGLNFLNELEANSFAALMMRNTNLSNTEQVGHLPGDIFSVPDYIIEMNTALQLNPDPVGDDPVLNALTPIVVREDRDGDGDIDFMQYKGLDHVVLGGTEEDDIIISGGGDDTIWGDGGNDYIEAGYGVDRVYGGDGNDIIVNAGTDIGETDFLRGGNGDDAIHGGSGLALLFGEDGNDFLSAGKDGKEVFGGEGDDFILGGEGADFLLGNEGDDWIEGGNGFDVISGDNSELFFNSTIIGNDVMFAGENENDFDAESGDDIMVQGESVMRNNGMAGFDWAIYKGSSVAANADLGIRIFVNQPDFILRDRFDLVEALSGWIHDDILTGAADILGAIGGQGGGAIPDPVEGSPVRSYSNALFESGVRLIDGLRDLVSHLEWDENDPDAVVMGVGEIIDDGTGGEENENEEEEFPEASDILIGGGGSDHITGKIGNDIIDGDAWLNVRISIRDKNDPTKEIRTVDSLEEIQAELLNGTYSPSQLKIVREILYDAMDGDEYAIDTAYYSEALANYDITKHADGRVTVNHARVTGDVDEDEGDGVDTLRNIEKLVFADGETLMLIDGIDGTASGDVINGTEDRDWINGFGGNDTIRALGGDDYIDGAEGNDQIFGGDGRDVLRGGEGNDLLDGGAGNDQMVGGLGNDIYVVDSADDQVSELAAQGTDMVRTAMSSHTLSDFVENLQFNGTGNFTGTGNSTSNTIWGGNGDDTLSGGASSDRLHGGEGNDLLDGGTGADLMVGGNGNDVYMVDVSGDIVQEEAGGGIDTVLASTNHTLAANVENLTYVGGGNFNGTGNELSNSITGGIGNDRLDGKAGADIMAGGAGNDIYIVDNAGDIVLENAGSGTDQVQTDLSTWALGDFIENLRYTGSGDFTGIGNQTSNTIWGGAGNDLISAGASADWLWGGAGNDTLEGGSGNDNFMFAAGFGNDTILDFDADATGGQDKLNVAGLGITAATFASAVVISQTGADTVVTIGDNSIKLLGISTDAITAEDFTFA